MNLIATFAVDKKKYIVAISLKRFQTLILFFVNKLCITRFVFNFIKSFRQLLFFLFELNPNKNKNHKVKLAENKKHTSTLILLRQGLAAKTTRTWIMLEILTA